MLLYCLLNIRDCDIPLCQTCIASSGLRPTLHEPHLPTATPALPPTPATLNLIPPRPHPATTLLLLLPKAQTHTINTMPLIRRRRIPLALKNMSQMAPTITANNLRPRHPKPAVHMPRHRARDAVEIRRPAAAGLELVRGLVEGCVAGRARVHARGRGVLVVDAGEGRFGAFLAEDAELFCEFV